MSHVDVAPSGSFQEDMLLKRLAQSDRAWHKAAWSYTMMLLAHAGGHSEGNQTFFGREINSESNDPDQGQLAYM